MVSRFRVHALMQWLEERELQGIVELTPGIRSLQVHFDQQMVSRASLIDTLMQAEEELDKLVDSVTIPSRIVHLPLSWDDEACQLAIDKYDQVVRKDAPWYPSNLEFIRRINGLDSIDDVKQIVFDASYLVMGLGDVYLGAPVATPINPAHRLVTTKYNPARTWTAENMQIRTDFPNGRYPIRIEQSTISLASLNNVIEEHTEQVHSFTAQRENAFRVELDNWRQTGQFNIDTTEPEPTEVSADWPEECVVIDSPVSGSVWQCQVVSGDIVERDQNLLILESMKMEIAITSPDALRVREVLFDPGQRITAGQPLIVLEIV